MDIVNHAVTLISIIVGIGLTEMFGNLHRLLRNRAQVSWDWLPVLWAASLLVLVINYWWAIYQGIIGLDHDGIIDRVIDWVQQLLIEAIKDGLKPCCSF